MMKRSLIVFALLILLGSLLWLTPLFAVETRTQIYNEIGASPVNQPVPATPGLQLRQPVAETALVTVAAEEIATKTKNAPLEKQGKQRRLVGVHVDVPAYENTVWERLTGPQGATSWRLAIVAPGAKYMRAHFTVFAPPARDLAVVYGELDPRQARAVRPGDADEGFWGPPVKGERLHLEVVTDSTAPPKIVVDQVVYGLQDLARATKESWCYLDPTCYTQWDELKTGIGHVSYESSGAAYVCSGALVADTSSSFTPWFLTANHCISNETEADTVVVSWRFFTDECNGTPPDFYSTPYSERSDLAFTDLQSDISLLELDEDPPNNTSFFGWTTTPVTVNDETSTLHHPDGAYMRITFGEITYAQYVFIFVLYSQSSTEGGSSGAPLFNASRQIVGVLSGGNASCDVMTSHDEYGKFVEAWGAGLDEYLDSGLPDDDDTTDDDDDITDDDDDVDDDDDDSYTPPDDDDDDDDDGEDQGPTDTRSDDDSGGGICG